MTSGLFGFAITGMYNQITFFSIARISISSPNTFNIYLHVKNSVSYEHARNVRHVQDGTQSLVTRKKIIQLCICYVLEQRPQK